MFLRPRRLLAALGCVAVAAAAACGSSAEDGAGHDAGLDASSDAASDAPSEASPDGASDASDDAIEAAADAADVADDTKVEAAAPCTLPDLGLTVATLAGCGVAGTEDGPRGVARFDNPVNVAVAADGRAFVADFDSNRVRVVDVTGATTTLVARPDVKRPFGLAVALDGSLYLETDDNDLGEHSTSTGTIWHVDTTTGSANVVVRNVGRPRGLAALADGRIAMADHMHHVVKLLVPSSGVVTLLAGAVDQPGYVNATGAAARFSQPYDVVQLPSGDLAVTDLDNARIRQVTLTGVVTDLAGSGAAGAQDGPVASATFNQPKGLAVDANGALYVTEVNNIDVRRIANGQVLKLAGGVQGWKDDDAPLSARFYAVEGVDFAADGRLVLADGNGGDDTDNHRVRVIHLSSPSIPP